MKTQATVQQPSARQGVKPRASARVTSQAKRTAIKPVLSEPPCVQQGDWPDNKPGPSDRLLKLIQNARLAEAEAEMATPANGSEADREPLQLKTYIVKFATRSPATDGASYRDDYSTGMVRAAHLYAAHEEAMKQHIPEAFETPPCGDWIMLGSDGNERLGFRIDDGAEVDEGCKYWIERMVEVRHEDVATIERYLLHWQRNRPHREP